jgi:hypothetical protein
MARSFSLRRSLRHVADPGRHVALGDRIRPEVGEIVAARQRELHLRQPLADMHHQELVGGELV